MAKAESLNLFEYEKGCVFRALLHLILKIKTHADNIVPGVRMSLLMVLAIRLFFGCFLLSAAWRDLKAQDYEEAMRIISGYPGRKCGNLATELRPLLGQSQKGIKKELDMGEHEPLLSPGERFVKAPEFYHRLGVSKSKFYQSVRDGSLPAPIRISPRNSVWPSNLVDKVMTDVKNGVLKF